MVQLVEVAFWCDGAKAVPHSKWQVFSVQMETQWKRAVGLPGPYSSRGRISEADRTQCVNNKQCKSVNKACEVKNNNNGSGEL